MTFKELIDEVFETDTEKEKAKIISRIAEETETDIEEIENAEVRGKSYDVLPIFELPNGKAYSIAFDCEQREAALKKYWQDRIEKEVPEIFKPYIDLKQLAETLDGGVLSPYDNEELNPIYDIFLYRID